MQLAFQQKIQAGFLVALTVLILIGAGAWWSARQNEAAFHAVAHTYQVDNQLQDLLSALIGAESGSRGFAVSGNENFLTPYTDDIASAQKSFNLVKQLTSDNPNQIRRLADLEPVIQRKIAGMNEVIARRRQGDAAGASQLIASGTGRQIMEDIRQKVAAMQAEEGSLLRQRAEKSQAQSHVTMMAVGLGTVAAVFFVGLAGYQVRRDFFGRQRAEEERDRFFMLSPDLLGMAKPDGYFKRVNPAVTEMLGWSVEEFLARPFIEFVHPDDRAATLREVEQQVVEGKKVLHFENRYQHKNGSWRTLSWKSTPHPDGLIYAVARDVTELKHAEAELRHAHEETLRERTRLQFIFDSAPIGLSFVFSHPDGRRTRLINDAHLNICGITREQADEPDTFTRITHPDDRQRQLPFTREVEQGNIDHYAMDKRYLKADGTVVWVYFSFQRRKFPDGSFEDLSIVVDITGRKQMEEDLRRSEENLAVTLHSIGDAVLATDDQGRVTRMNFIAEKLTGWPQAEALGRPIGEVFHIINEATRRPTEIPVAKVLASGEIHGLANHTIIIARDGTEYPIADSAAPIRDRDGHILGVVLIFRDVTEEKRAERAIAESERQLRVANAELTRLAEERSVALQSTGRLAHAALDALSAHVAILDEHGVIIADNKSWQEFTGNNPLLPALSGEGANYLEVCSRATGPAADTAGKVARAIREIIAGHQKDFTLEYDAHLPSEKRWFLCRVTRFASPGPARVVVALENITQMKLMERQQIRNQRMESLGTLAGGVAHDLNNALAPVIMGVQLLKEKYPNDSAIVDMFHTSARRGADMVRQLLTFARGAEGERNAIQLTHLIKELQNIIKGTFPKNIQLEVNYEKNLPTVLGDATQLHQVLLNLCVNARDAMPQGGKLSINVLVREVDAVYASSIPDAMPGKYVVLSVHDTGTGIPPEIIDRIFDPFFTTKGPDKGTGLGLSTVSGIVRSHGGFLQVYSHPGEGSIFKAFLPADRVEGETTHVPKLVNGFQGNGETILLVDDEAAIRKIARVVLRRLNFNPITATDGMDALVQLAEHRTNLRAVITDLHMPHMDGLTYVRTLRRMLPNIPVVISSGRMEEKEREEFKNLGVSACLDKPFTEAQLAEVLKQVLAPKT